MEEEKELYTSLLQVPLWSQLRTQKKTAATLGLESINVNLIFTTS